MKRIEKQEELVMQSFNVIRGNGKENNLPDRFESGRVGNEDT